MTRFAWFDRPGARRAAMAVAVLLCAVLALFPRHHVARAVIAPGIADSTTRSTFGTLGAHSGERIGGSRLADPMAIATVEARSAATRDAVIGALDLVGSSHAFADADAARRAIDAMVDVHPLAGGMIEIVAVGRNAPLTLAVTQAYLRAIGSRIAPIVGTAVVADPAHLETARQLNSPAVALLGLLALFAFFVECRSHIENRPEEDQ